MKNKKKSELVTIFSICGIVLILLITAGIKLFLFNPEKKFENDVISIYELVTKNFKDDLVNKVKTTGKYSGQSYLTNGKELIYFAEFNLETDELKHLCVNDDEKMINLNANNIDLRYVKENNLPVYTKNQCSFN